jgi:hypothetical protein
MWDGQKTVEHILPQDPEEGTWTEFTDEDRQNVVHTLGNLVLLTSRKNSGASRLEFTKKLKVYFGLGKTLASKKIATYASVQELAHIANWNLNTYQIRHKQNLELLSARWHLAPPI